MQSNSPESQTSRRIFGGFDTSFDVSLKWIESDGFFTLWVGQFLLGEGDEKIGHTGDNKLEWRRMGWGEGKLNWELMAPQVRCPGLLISSFIDYLFWVFAKICEIFTGRWSQQQIYFTGICDRLNKMLRSGVCRQLSRWERVNHDKHERQINLSPTGQY